MMNDEQALKATIETVKAFSTIDGKMQLHTLQTLLEIALASLQKRDISNRDVEVRVGLQSGTATRNVWYWTQDGTPEMSGSSGFVEIKFDPSDRCKRRLVMTPKGRTFIKGALTPIMDKAAAAASGGKTDG